MWEVLPHEGLQTALCDVSVLSALLLVQKSLLQRECPIDRHGQESWEDHLLLRGTLCVQESVIDGPSHGWAS